LTNNKGAKAAEAANGTATNASGKFVPDTNVAAE
jgi:hypothetical protein